MSGEFAAATRLPIKERRWITVAAPVIFGLLLLVLWQAAVIIFEIDPYVVPAPSDIAASVAEIRSQILAGMLVTGRNALIGLIGGTVVGLCWALAAYGSRLVDGLSRVPIAALAVMPIVALAPVLYSMYGAAQDTARMLVAGLAVMIPVFINTLRGLRQVSRLHRDLMRSYAATRWQVVRIVTVPTALPYFFTGLRIASSLAVISALVAEYFGGRIGGLGKSITSSAASSNYPAAWAYVIGSIALGLAFYLVTLALELWSGRHRTS